MKRYLLLIILLAGFAGGAAYNCSSCEDCTGKIENASAGDTVYLVVNLSNQSGNCLEFYGVEGVTLDCQVNEIGGKYIIVGEEHFGIYLHNSSNNTIRNCKAYSFHSGIYLKRSNNNLVINNEFIGNLLDGILLLNYSGDNTIQNNLFEDNGRYGVHLIFSCSNNRIQINNITSNLSGEIEVNGGIKIAVSSTNNTIIDNVINNDRVSMGEIYIYDAEDNVIYHNNVLRSPYMRDAGVNSWDNGSEGNYWSDYSGNDSDEDGIGDIPYYIDGGGQDNYPLMEPYDQCSVKGDRYVCDKTVSDYELLNYINQWVSEEVTDFDLLAAIDNWASG